MNPTRSILKCSDTVRPRETERHRRAGKRGERMRICRAPGFGVTPTSPISGKAGRYSTTYPPDVQHRDHAGEKKGRPVGRPFGTHLVTQRAQNSTVKREKSEELVKLLDLVTYCLSLIWPVPEI